MAWKSVFRWFWWGRTKSTDRGIWWRNETTQACVAHSLELNKDYINNFWCIIGINENNSLQVCCIKWNKKKSLKVEVLRVRKTKREVGREVPWVPVISHLIIMAKLRGRFYYLFITKRNRRLTLSKRRKL